MIYIYTKETCHYCVRAKKLLQSYGLDYEERKIVKRDDEIHKQLKLMVPDARTVPQIFHQEGLKRTHVGGYEELVDWLETKT